MVEVFLIIVFYLLIQAIAVGAVNFAMKDWDE